jgi:hypothetical protein
MLPTPSAKLAQCTKVVVERRCEVPTSSNYLAFPKSTKKTAEHSMVAELLQRNHDASLQI